MHAGNRTSMPLALADTPPQAAEALASFDHEPIPLDNTATEAVSGGLVPLAAFLVGMSVGIPAGALWSRFG